MIGTHSGVFHADDAFAVCVLEGCPEFADLDIVRTRDVEKLDMCEVVVDVGDVYDHAARRYDHHQREGAPAPRANGIPYSGFGLVWRHFGRRWLETQYPMNDEVELVWDRVDRVLVQPTDAADCGHSLAEYGEVRPFTSSALISGMNPNWDDDEDPDLAFERACGVAHQILCQVAENAISWAEAKSAVEDAIARSEGGIVVFTRQAPWQEHLFASSSVKADEALFVVYPNPSGTPNYMVQCVPDQLGSFGKRKALPESWAGLRGDELAAEANVKTAVFCHVGRFICGTDELDDALKMACMAVDA